MVLVYQLPARPSNARVKTWRRLQELGAVPLKNSVYVLPNSPQAHEDFEWMKAEVVALKGEATVLAADTVDVFASEEIVATFHSARQRDFDDIRGQIEKLLNRRPSKRSAKGLVLRSLERKALSLGERWKKIAAIDFFDSPGRGEAAAALEELKRLLAGGQPTESTGEKGALLMTEAFQNRIWVTRPRPGVDRMSSAWLIRRFIDPGAQFSFADKPEQAGSAVPFDMYGVEFSHRGTRCTFETLALRFGISNRAVKSLGQIVHDLDLKDARYKPPEGPAIERLVEGLRQVVADDHELLERGMTIFEALYRSFVADVAPAKKQVKSSSRPRSAR